MIKDRIIADDLAKRYGSKKDVAYLRTLVFQKKVDQKDMMKVLEYWVDKLNKVTEDFNSGKIKTLSDVADNYAQIKCIQSIIGGKIVED